ncbi:FAD-dependent oxidoreductase [Antribacter gilvus]|uniref:FAD-dependent oxidoreductase n=1 Tax=Antribacter gilvus TaxID=2304675 RepID=UPI000F77780B|nr:FAD-dependent oxidoreductase [Antribacter gilvus]
MSEHAQQPEADVVVVGAGPTGLLLAGDLATAGVRVTLVDRRPPGISNLSRAFAVHARSLEQLDARGLADDLEARGRALSTLRLFGSLSLDLATLPSRFAHVLVVPQYEVERALEARAVAAGVAFRHETEVTGLEQDAGGVVVHGTTPDGPVSLRAAYVVGCDGHRSAVRRLVGLPFPGRAVIRSMILADVRLAEPPTDVITVAVEDDAFCFVAPFGDGYHRVIGWRWGHDVAEDTPLGLDEVRDTMRQALGTDLGLIDARWTSRFHSDERQAPSYRVGRVFVAGDAAHVHSPAGGQGMNTGLQDAANLSWKLAAAVRGDVADAEALLDSYQSERHPVGRLVLRMSGGLVRAARSRGLVSRLLELGISGVAGHVAPARRRAMGLVSGIGLAYGRPRGAHPLVGRRAADVPLVAGPAGERLYEALRSGRFVLVLPPDVLPPDDGPGSPARPTPGSQYARWADGAVVVRRADGEGTALLVRPDAYVAWAA